MKIFTIKYKYCWSGRNPSVAAIVAEDFADAKRKLRAILSENCDITGYLNLEAWVDKDAAMDFEEALNSARKLVPENKVNEYVVKDIIE